MRDAPKATRDEITLVITFASKSATLSMRCLESVCELASACSKREILSRSASLPPD